MRANYSYFNGPDGLYLTGPLAVGPFSSPDEVLRAISLFEQGFSGARTVQAIMPHPNLTGQEVADDNSGK